MQTVTTTLTTEAVFSDDHIKRYLLRKTWDDTKPTLAIIMLAPSDAAGIELDSTTLLVLNNASRLGYGSVHILNLFATLNDFALKEAEGEDADNINAIVQSAEKADTLIYAAGTEKQKIKSFYAVRRRYSRPSGPMSPSSTASPTPPARPASSTPFPRQSVNGTCRL